MSFGDPHNPYGQQPPQAPQGQPGYGYPQQAPQGIPPQGGYAYPQQAPQGYPGGPVGYPGAHMEMPGGVKAARVILFILGGLHILGAVLALIGSVMFAAAFSESGDSYGSSTDDVLALGGVFVVITLIVSLGFALWAILTAAKLGKGRGGVRASGIVYGSLLALFSGLGLLFSLIGMSAGGGTPVGGAIISLLLNVIMLALGIWIIVGLAKAGDYFRRPGH
ncbi:proline-rich domain-containing protein [Streptomyces sp. NPDC054849]